MRRETPIETLDRCRAAAANIGSMEREYRRLMDVATRTTAQWSDMPRSGNRPGDKIGTVVAKREEMLARMAGRIKRALEDIEAADTIIDTLDPITEQCFARDFWVNALSVESAAEHNNISRSSGYRTLARLRAKLRG